jgi:hypothetical protein
MEHDPDAAHSIFHDHITTLHEQHLSLLAQPAPSHAGYLLRLHELSIRRDGMLLAARVQSQRSQELAKRLYVAEVERTEEEYEHARRSIKDRLLEACQERSRKLREEKDSADLNLGARYPLPCGKSSVNGRTENLFDAPPRPHATRRRPPLVNGGHRSNGSSGGGPVPLPSPDSLGMPLTNGVEPYTFSILPASPSLASFPLAGTSAAAAAVAAVPPNANGTPLLNQLAALTSSAAAGVVPRGAARKRGGPGGPGLPQQVASAVIVPGKYEQAKRCYAALAPLKADEVNEDLDVRVPGALCGRNRRVELAQAVRKKRKRGGENRGQAAKRAAMADREL